MLPAPPVGGGQGPLEDPRLQSLVDAIDLIGRYGELGDLLPRLALCLQPVADVDLLFAVLPHDESSAARLYSVRLVPSDSASAPG